LCGDCLAVGGWRLTICLAMKGMNPGAVLTTEARRNKVKSKTELKEWRRPQRGEAATKVP